MIKISILAAAAALLTAACIIGTPTPELTPVQGEGTAGGGQPPPAATSAPGSSPGATSVPAAPSTPTPQSVIVQGLTIKQYAEPPQIAIDPTTRYTATFRTSSGPFTVELFASQAPVTVNNFVFLAQEGFYDDLIFHRVIPGFMLQSGDPTGTGREGPGYQFRDEIVPELAFNQPGILAMANAGPGTNGSQFFITVAPTPHLNGAHTIFGHVVAGQEILDAISGVRTGAGDRPLDPVVIQSIDIIVGG